MLKFKYSDRQFKALEGLAYWAQELAWTLERYGENDSDLPRVRASVEMSFSECARLDIPAWVQNAVYGFGNDWRRYASTYLDLYLNARDITREAA